MTNPELASEGARSDPALCHVASSVGMDMEVVWAHAQLKEEIWDAKAAMWLSLAGLLMWALWSLFRSPGLHILADEFASILSIGIICSIFRIHQVRRRMTDPTLPGRFCRTVTLIERVIKQKWDPAANDDTLPFSLESASVWRLVVFTSASTMNIAADYVMATHEIASDLSSDDPEGVHCRIQYGEEFGILDCVFKFREEQVAYLRPLRSAARIVQLAS